MNCGKHPGESSASTRRPASLPGPLSIPSSASSSLLPNLSASSNLKSTYLKKTFVKKFNSDSNKQEKKRLEDEFFTKKGLGAALMQEYQQIKNSLSLPRFLIDAYRKLDEGHQLDDKELQKVLEKLRYHFSEDQHFILPSFYKLISYLKLLKKDFAILFRSFGMDIKEVAIEFNQFCNQLRPRRASFVQRQKRNSFVQNGRS